MSQEPETLLPWATKNEKIWHQSYTEEKKTHAIIICREFEIALFKSIDYKVKPKKGDLQKDIKMFLTSKF